MRFTTDKQTLEDLNVFGKHGGESIYSIFNHCATPGGATVLEDWFNYPLSDADSINRRSGIIRFFVGRGTLFPFESSKFDAIGQYLDDTDERSRLSAQETNISGKLGKLIAPDARTAAIHSGIVALVELLTVMDSFIGSLNLRADDYYKSEAASITSMLKEIGFAGVTVHPVKNKLSQASLAEYDALFRFRSRDIIQKILRHVYYLDVYLSVGKVAQQRKFVFPKALPKERHEMILEGVFHPHVKNAVPNSIMVNPAGNVIFLTGANMAGKSTFMKSLSVCVFLAHMGFPVPASKMEFAVLDGIYTTINLPDDLGMGASHFYAEVLRVKKMAKELAQGKNLYIVFDELFRGTNVKDAYEATIAITGGFATKRNSLFVISTHIIEAGEVLRQRHDNIRFVYLPTKMEGGKPIYTYKLEVGITDDRHGMVIINNEGIIDILEAGLVAKT